MTTPTIIVDIRYVHAKRKSEDKPHPKDKLCNLLKYLQYRDGSVRREIFGATPAGEEQRYPDGVSDYQPPMHRDASWVDCGMGSSYKEILGNAEKLRSKSVLARTWVLSPDPELMCYVPEEHRLNLMNRLTERTVQQWYEDNEWEPEYSYVVHDKKRKGDDVQMLHSHIVTPGTTPVDLGYEGQRTAHYVSKPYLVDLQMTAGRVFQEEMERVLGRTRTQEILWEREQRLAASRTRQAGLQTDREEVLGVNRTKEITPYPGGRSLAQLEAERNEAFLRQERMMKLQRLHDLLQLVRRSKKPRKRNVMREIRMYARYLRDRRWKLTVSEQRARWDVQAAKRRKAQLSLHAARLQIAREERRQQVDELRQKAEQKHKAQQESERSKEMFVPPSTAQLRAADTRQRIEEEARARMTTEEFNAWFALRKFSERPSFFSRSSREEDTQQTNECSADLERGRERSRKPKNRKDD